MGVFAMTMTTASETSTTSPTMAELTMIECRPAMTGDCPAQTRQHQVYQAIMKNSKFKRACNLVGILKMLLFISAFVELPLAF